jgi:hypothetical protein
MAGISTVMARAQSCRELRAEKFAGASELARPVVLDEVCRQQEHRKGPWWKLGPYVQDHVRL